MIRRWPSRFAILALALAISSLAQPPLAAAVIQKTFRLSNQGETSVPRIDFNVVPPGAIVPSSADPDPQDSGADGGSPLLILPDSTGFDEDHFSVALGSKPGEQVLRLLFGQTQTVDSTGNVVFVQSTGADGLPIGLFEPGGILNFSLTIEESAADALMLHLPEPAGGLVLQSWPLDDVDVTPDPSTGGPPPGGGSQPPDASQIPEPLPVMLWGGLLAAGLFRIRLRHPNRAA